MKTASLSIALAAVGLINSILPAKARLGGSAQECAEKSWRIRI